MYYGMQSIKCENISAGMAVSMRFSNSGQCKWHEKEQTPNAMIYAFHCTGNRALNAIAMHIRRNGKYEFAKMMEQLKIFFSKCHCQHFSRTQYVESQSIIAIELYTNSPIFISQSEVKMRIYFCSVE